MNMKHIAMISRAKVMIVSIGAPMLIFSIIKPLLTQSLRTNQACVITEMMTILWIQLKIRDLEKNSGCRILRRGPKSLANKERKVTTSV